MGGDGGGDGGGDEEEGRDEGRGKGRDKGGDKGRDGFIGFSLLVAHVSSFLHEGYVSLPVSG